MKIFDAIKKAFGGKLSRGPAPATSGFSFSWWFTFPFLFDKKMDEFSGIVYACVDLRAKTVARAKFRVYQEIDSDELEELSSGHDAYKFLNKINPYLTRFQFFYITVVNLDLTGNAFWYIPRYPDGIPREAWVIPSGLVRIVPKNAIEVSHYEVYLNGEIVKFQTDEILHFKYPDPKSFFWGKGPLQAVLISAEADEYMRQYWQKFFENSGVIKYAFESEPGTSLQTLQKFREDLINLYSGIENAGRPAVLPPGVKIRPVQLTPAELDWIKSRQVTIEDIIVAFGTPKSKLGLETGINKAIAEASDYTFKADVIEPILTLFDEILTKFMRERFDENLVVLHDSVVPKDRETQLNEYTRFLQWGVITQNEIRKKEGFKPYPGGDTFWFPVNYAPIGVMEENKDIRYELSFKQETRNVNTLDIEWRRISTFAKRWENIIELKFRSLFKEQMNEILRKLMQKRAYELRKIEDFIDLDIERWVERFRGEVEEVVLDMLKAAFERAIENMGESTDVYSFTKDNQIVVEILNALNSQIRDINETTLRQLNDLLRDELAQWDGSAEKLREIANKIREYFNSVALQRARAIAITTATAGINASTQYALEEAGVRYKVWLSQRDARVRDSHKELDGEKVSIDSAFKVRSRKGLAILRFPGDPQAPAEEVVNCRCYIIGTNRSD